MNIILKLKRIAIIFIATIIFFAGSFAFPNTEQKAHAILWGAAVPGGVTIGAGTYAIGALILAGGLGIAGYADHSEAINAHAKQVWADGINTAGDSINWSIEQAIDAGNGLVNLQGDFINFVDGKLSSIVNDTTTLITPEVVGDYTFYPSERFTNIHLDYEKTGMAFASSGGLYTDLQILVDDYWVDIEFQYSLKPGVPDVGVEINKNQNPALYEKFYTHAKKAVQDRTYSSFMALAAMMGLTGSSVKVQEWENNKGLIETNMNEAWRSMRDAGLVLPVDSAVPINNVDGTPLTYNPDTNTYTGIDGGLYTGTPEWVFPQPKIRLANPDIPTTGVYVDTPVMTGNPTYDDSIIGNPAIPKTTTNIYTGVTVANPDIPNVSNPPIEGEIPPTNPPPSQWEKPPSKKPPNIGALVTTKFPFSLPWDFFGVLGWLNAEPKAPVFKLDTGLNTPFGKELKMDMEFKFNFLDDYIGFFRSFIIIGFSLFLILATRKLLGGAG